MVFHDNHAIIDTTGDLFYSFGIGGKRGILENDVGQYCEREYVFGACAGAAIYRRSMLDDVGLLDEDFFIYDDDIDLSFRAQLFGYKCLYVPDAVVYHYVSGTVGQLSDRSLYLARRNSAYVLVKNLPVDILLRRFFYILLYFILGDIFYIFRGRWRTILRCRIDTFRHLPKMFRKRQEIQKKKRISSRYIESLFTRVSLKAAFRKKGF
jgi:GT2 family glycosyltransferase